ncbi:hypothetical protein JCM10213_002514 [Rhodosporidiobolus nylandii]
MYSALKAHDVLQRDFYMTLRPGKALYPLRQAVSQDIERLASAALAVMRFLWHTQPAVQAAAQPASRLVNIAWGDVEEWRAIQIWQRDECIKRAVVTEHNTGVVRQYFVLALNHFQEFTDAWHKDSPKYATHDPLPPPFVMMNTYLTTSHNAIQQLKKAWTAEVDAFVSRDLRQRAQQGSRSAWYFLQYRAMGFAPGIERSTALRGELGKGLGRFLDGVRSRGGISSDDYVEYLDKLQQFLPPGVRVQPKKELCRR